MSHRDSKTVRAIYRGLHEDLSNEFGLSHAAISIIRGEYFLMPEGTTQADFAHYIADRMNETNSKKRKENLQETLNFVASASGDLWARATMKVTKSSALQRFLSELSHKIAVLYDETILEQGDPEVLNLLASQREKVQAMLTTIVDTWEDTNAKPTEN